MRLFCAFIVSCSLPLLEGRPTGAPASACDSMTPGHMSESSDVPIVTIALSSQTYTANQQITVTLTATASNTFRGFLVQPRAEGAADSDSTIGTIVASGSTSATNNCGSKSEVTHIDNSDKTEVTFTWTAPSSNQGNVVIMYTIVKTNTVNYWSKMESAPITPDFPTPTGPTTLPLTTTAVDTTTQSIASLTSDLSDSACGVSKGCISSSGWLCTWADVGGSCGIRMEIKGTTGYTAVGLSSDRGMGDDYVLGCSNNGGTVRVFNAYNSPERNNDPFTDETLGITVLGTGVVNNVAVCYFCRAKTLTTANTSGRRKKRAVSATDTTFKDMNSDWYILVATGSQAGGYITKHSSAPIISATKADFQSFQVLEAQTISYPMIKAHGCMMQFAWIMFAGVGVVMALFLKNEWSENRIFGEKVWFQIHRLCMVMTFLLTTTAFIVIFVHVDGFSDIISESNLQNAHPVLGIILMSLTVINVIMGFLRPKPDAKYRVIFNLCHWFIGGSANVFALLCIFGGITFDHAQVSGAATGVMFGFLSWYICIHIIYICINCVLGQNEFPGMVHTKVSNNKMDNTGNDEYVIKENDKQHPNTSKEEPKSGVTASKIKEILFYLHVAAVVGFTLAVVTVTGMTVSNQE